MHYQRSVGGSERLVTPALRLKVQPPVEIFHGDGDIDFAIMDRSL
jgi:hypothetical protein